MQPIDSSRRRLRPRREWSLAANEEFEPYFDDYIAEVVAQFSFPKIRTKLTHASGRGC